MLQSAVGSFSPGPTQISSLVGIVRYRQASIKQAGHNHNLTDNQRAVIEPLVLLSTRVANHGGPVSRSHFGNILAYPSFFLGGPPWVSPYKVALLCYWLIVCG
jgi:hypothetical protein